MFSLREVLAPSAGIFVTATGNVRISGLALINVPNIPSLTRMATLHFQNFSTSVGFRFELPRPQQFPAALSPARV